MLQEYHSTLGDSLKAMGYSHKHITLEELWKEYDSKAVYGLFTACCILPAILYDKGVDMEGLMATGTPQNFDAYNADVHTKNAARIWWERSAYMLNYGGINLSDQSRLSFIVGWLINLS